jgi:hypothetical protein
MYQLEDVLDSSRNASSLGSDALVQRNASYSAGILFQCNSPTEFGIIEFSFLRRVGVTAGGPES